MVSDVKLITRFNKIRKIDVGSLRITLGKKCQICGKYTDTVTVSELRVCASCIYISGRMLKKAADEQRLEETANKVNRIARAVIEGAIEAMTSYSTRTVGRAGKVIRTVSGGKTR